MSFINEQGFLSNSTLKLVTELNQIHKFFKNFKNNYNFTTPNFWKLFDNLILKIVGNFNLNGDCWRT